MSKSIIFSIFILITISGCLPSGLQLPSDQFEPEPVPLETFPLLELEFYDRENNTLIYVADNSETIQWNSILENNCQTHQLNHPGYDKTVLAKGTHENGELNYKLRINSETRNVDLFPLQIEENYIVELGVYRCEGLEELIEGFSLIEP